MSDRQLNLFDHWPKPLPFDTSTVAKRLGISSSTLHRYKRMKKRYEGDVAIVEYAESRGRRDYWRVYER
ncbi:hypothetical protein [Baaleninema sp.]|uniref:hypothetical protein n=1 Tax=Baaleninema sp. TaxID=3101197 RepID=UPI003D07B01C